MIRVKGGGGVGVIGSRVGRGTVAVESRGGGVYSWGYRGGGV